jgi:hypothetical protein
VKDDAERPLETAVGRLSSAALCGRLNEKWSIAEFNQLLLITPRDNLIKAI